MNWGSGVAARLGCLSLDNKGRPVIPLLAADAVRCGLVVDLALAGRVASTADAVSIDVSPTGFPPADALLDAIAVEPDRALESWFSDGLLTLHQVLGALETLDELHGRSTLFGGRRYTTANPSRRQTDKEWKFPSFPAPASPADAAVLAFGSMAHLIGPFRQLGYVVDPPDIPDELLTRAEDHEWLVRAGVDYLRTRRAQYRYVDSVRN